MSGESSDPAKILTPGSGIAELAIKQMLSTKTNLLEIKRQRDLRRLQEQAKAPPAVNRSTTKTLQLTKENKKSMFESVKERVLFNFFAQEFLQEQNRIADQSNPKLRLRPFYIGNHDPENGKFDRDCTAEEIAEKKLRLECEKFFLDSTESRNEFDFWLSMQDQMGSAMMGEFIMN